MKNQKHPQVEVTGKEEDSITIQIKFPIIPSSMLSTEELIQEGLNTAGKLATEHALCSHDTDGSPIIKGNIKYTSKGLTVKEYQCPYGVAVVARQVYQSNEGGAVFCPLDDKACIIGSSTPRFAKTVAWKYSNLTPSAVSEDLSMNHGRAVSTKFIQDIGQLVASKIESKAEAWHYRDPVDAAEVYAVGLSLDGTCLLMVGGLYRQAMVGSISLYDKGGERLHTLYVAAAPEYGKETFYDKFRGKIEDAKTKYPGAAWAGIADGAKDNWAFLAPYVAHQIIDFYHVTEYLSKLSAATIKDKAERDKWAEAACHQLRHGPRGAKALLKKMKAMVPYKKGKAMLEDVAKTITYFENNIDKMEYAAYADKNLPIGSGVIEAACKVIIKQRLGNAGMKWKNEGAQAVMNLRCYGRSDGVWEQIWDKIDRYGF